MMMMDSNSAAEAAPKGPDGCLALRAYPSGRVCEGGRPAAGDARVAAAA